MLLTVCQPPFSRQTRHQISRQKLITPLALIALLFSASTSAQHEHDHGMPLNSNSIGAEHVQFATHCEAGTHNDFNRGVALMHSFWFAEAINSFQAVLEQDADCAMAHWGIAMSHWGNPFAGQRNQQQLARGQAAAELARNTGTPDARESAYIAAVSELFTDDNGATQRARTLAYEQAMAKVVDDWPDDAEAQIFYALAMNQTADPTDMSYTQQLGAAAILEPLFMENPDHPGIAHYLIHAYDHPPLADRALGAALRYASLAPDAPHALHMPSHTFTRIGMWQESVDTNLRSASIARENNDPGAELHALDYQTYAYLQMAQDEAAQQVVERAAELLNEVDITAVGATQAGAFAIAAIPARYALERGDYEMAARLSVHRAEQTPHTQALTHFARALGAAMTGDPAAASEEAQQLARLRDLSEARRDDYWTEQIDIQRQIAEAWADYASGNQESAIRLLTAAADREDKADKAAVTPGPLAPARELLGRILLEVGRPADALAAFEATLIKEPNRFMALYGAASAAEAAGESHQAALYYQQLLEVAATGDGERPALVTITK